MNFPLVLGRRKANKAPARATGALLRLELGFHVAARDKPRAFFAATFVCSISERRRVLGMKSVAASALARRAGGAAGF